VVVGSAFVCVIGLGLLILFGRQFGMIRIADVAKPRKRTEPIILMHAPAGPTGRVEGWAGGMWISVEGNLELMSGGNSLNLRATPTGLTGTVNGMPVSCRNLTIDTGTGRLTVDDPELLARIGTDFDFRVGP